MLASNTQSESLLLWGSDFVFMCSLSSKGQKQEFPSLRCELDWGGGSGGGGGWIQPAGHHLVHCLFLSGPQAKRGFTSLDVNGLLAFPGEQLLRMLCTLLLGPQA